jgi:SAM-dependent methyltransferase
VPPLETMKRARLKLIALAMAFLAGMATAQVPARKPSAGSLRAPDVAYEPSEMSVVRSMLRLAKVGKGDVVYDLGCGDGRIPIVAAREFGARGVCVDIDPKRTAAAIANAFKAGVGERVEVRNEDLFETEIVGATVVMLFLWPEVNMRLRPRLLRELVPGTRVVSHFHDMEDWTPQETIRVRANNYDRNLYLWVIPPR